MSKYTANIHLEDENNTTTQIYNHVKENSLVFDVGCASGYFDEVLVKEKKCTVIGLEIDEKDAKKAENFCKFVLRDDIESLSWEEKLKAYKFDHIIFADVLEHLKDPAKTLSRLNKYLKPDGTVLVSIPNIAHVSIRLELLGGNFQREKTGILDDTHLQYFTKNSFIATASEAGYQARKIAAYSFDFPEKWVKEYLEDLGFQATTKALKLLSSPEAVANQYFFELIPTGKARKAVTTEDKPIYNVRKFLVSVEEDHKKFKEIHEREIQKLRELNITLIRENNELKIKLESAERKLTVKIKNTLTRLVKGNNGK